MRATGSLFRPGYPDRSHRLAQPRLSYFFPIARFDGELIFFNYVFVADI